MRWLKKRRDAKRRPQDIADFQTYCREIQAANTPEEVQAAVDRYEKVKADRGF